MHGVRSRAEAGAAATLPALLPPESRPLPRLPADADAARRSASGLRAQRWRPDACAPAQIRLPTRAGGANGRAACLLPGTESAAGRSARAGAAAPVAPAQARIQSVGAAWPSCGTTKRAGDRHALTSPATQHAATDQHRKQARTRTKCTGCFLLRARAGGTSCVVDRRRAHDWGDAA